MFFKKFFQQKVEPKETLVQSAVKQYASLRSDRIRRAFSSDMSIIRINVCKKTLPEYVDFLKYLSSKLETDQMLPNTQLKAEVHTVYLRDFFISKDRHFIDPVTSMKGFSEEACRFLQVYERTELAKEQTFSSEKNTSLTRFVVSNLITLLKEL